MNENEKLFFERGKAVERLRYLLEQALIEVVSQKDLKYNWNTSEGATRFQRELIDDALRVLDQLPWTGSRTVYIEDLSKRK